jgi:hypothetical protein
MSNRELLPPWQARDQREREWMQEWVCAQLDELRQRDTEASIDRIIASSKDPDAVRAQRQLDATIKAFECGDPEPLRRLLERHDPRLRQCINLPKRGVGERFKKRRALTEREIGLAQARRELPRIHAIWKKHYGKVYRPQNQLRATEILATRRNLDEDEIIKGRLSREN